MQIVLDQPRPAGSLVRFYVSARVPNPVTCRKNGSCAPLQITAKCDGWIYVVTGYHHAHAGIQWTLGRGRISIPDLVALVRAHQQALFDGKHATISVPTIDVELTNDYSKTLYKHTLTLNVAIDTPVDLTYAVPPDLAKLQKACDIASQRLPAAHIRDMVPDVGLVPMAAVMAPPRHVHPAYVDPVLWMDTISTVLALNRLKTVKPFRGKHRAGRAQRLLADTLLLLVRGGVVFIGDQTMDAQDIPCPAENMAGVTGDGSVLTGDCEDFVSMLVYMFTALQHLYHAVAADADWLAAARLHFAGYKTHAAFEIWLGLLLVTQQLTMVAALTEYTTSTGPAKHMVALLVSRVALQGWLQGDPVPKSSLQALLLDGTNLVVKRVSQPTLHVDLPLVLKSVDDILVPTLPDYTQIYRLFFDNSVCVPLVQNNYVGLWDFLHMLESGAPATSVYKQIDDTTELRRYQKTRLGPPPIYPVDAKLHRRMCQMLRRFGQPAFILVPWDFLRECDVPGFNVLYLRLFARDDKEPNSVILFPKSSN